MTTVAYLFAGVAALIHVYIFWLESLAWTAPRTRAVFGTTAETAATTQSLAYNQGFYNLFLAVVTGVGIGIGVSGTSDSVAAALVYAGCGSMLAAALVLVQSNRKALRAALIQGTAPALAVAALLLS